MKQPTLGGTGMSESLLIAGARGEVPLRSKAPHLLGGQQVLRPPQCMLLYFLPARSLETASE